MNTISTKKPTWRSAGGQIFSGHTSERTDEAGELPPRSLPPSARRPLGRSPFAFVARGGAADATVDQLTEIGASYGRAEMGFTLLTPSLYNPLSCFTYYNNASFFDKLVTMATLMYRARYSTEKCPSARDRRARLSPSESRLDHT